jgi:PHS family inorganic phosphate transporter-like MFS transporter
MASFHEKGSVGSGDKVATRNDAAFALDERRRAALAEVDNAKFSCVFLLKSLIFISLILSSDGSMQKSASSLVSVSSPTRASICVFPYIFSTHFPLFYLATISSRSTSHRRCWVMSTARVSFLLSSFFGSPTNYSAGQKLNKNQDLGVKVATPVGTFFGQLLFGWLADVVGRKRMCELESTILLSDHLSCSPALF